jgi:hypothetical protein
MGLEIADTQERIALEIRIVNLTKRAGEAEAEANSLKALVKEKNAQVIRLEAENVRLKMVRTDKELQAQVDGLRKEVGQKDRALVDYKRQLDKFLENEKMILVRAASAEQKVSILQATIATMQTARDVSERRVEAAVCVARDAEAMSAASVERAAKAARDALAATKPFELLLKLAEAIVLKSPSLNRNEIEVKSFRTALETHRKSKGAATGG